VHICECKSTDVTIPTEYTTCVYGIPDNYIINTIILHQITSKTVKDTIAMSKEYRLDCIIARGRFTHFKI